MESRLEKIFSMGINSMSLAVWLGEDRKCSALQPVVLLYRCRIQFFRIPYTIREFKIYYALVAKTSLKIANSSLPIVFLMMSVCLTFER